MSEQITVSVTDFIKGGSDALPIEVALTLLSRDYKGINNYGFNCVIEIERIEDGQDDMPEQ